jgi:hypothetical protein
MFQRTSRLIAAALPGRITGLIDYHRGYRTFYPWGGPMNGQTARLEITRSIIERYGIEQIIETGTFRGTTTEWFSQFGIPVLSAEVKIRFASFAQRRLAHRHNVQIECSDSTAALKRWSKASEIVSRRTLFYLDAHWQDHLPLREELEIISRNFTSWIAIIDDFKVPLDTDYGFDDYGPGQVLDMEYVRRCNIPGAIAFYPAVVGKWETGMKRGCAIIVANQELATKCFEMPMLRPATTVLDCK